LPNLSIAGKLYSIFALLAMTVVWLAVVSAVNARRHADLAEQFETAFSGAQNVERANAMIYAVNMEWRGIGLAQDKEAAKPHIDNLLSFVDRIGAVVSEWQTHVSDDEASQFSEFAVRIGRFQNIGEELVKRTSQEGPKAAYEWGQGDANRSIQFALNKDLESLGDFYRHKAQRVFSQIHSDIDSTAVWASGLALVAIALAALGVVIIWRAIARPLAAITKVTEAVADGKSGIDVPHRMRRDEIGALARSIAIFQAAMSHNAELNKTIGREADARARREEKVSAEIERFSGVMESTLAHLGGLSDKMLMSAAELSGAADQAASKSAGANAASRDASENVRDIAAAADELSASVMEIERQVTQSSAIAGKAVAEAERTALAVKELDEAARRIGDVVGLITDIAEQTNLLALNATIEAARAGDAGRGFAVVAGEVKALAGQTARATEDIAAQIAGMQQATSRSIAAIGGIERTIREIGDVSGAIAAAVTEQGAATQEIARGAETAASRTTETADEVERLGAAAMDTRANASAVKTVSDELGGVAQAVRSQVDEFFRQLRAG
jgi:methyl-accepting chemotaxis protein